MSKKYQTIFLIIAFLLQGCRPTVFDVTENCVWPPQPYNDKTSFPGTIILSLPYEEGLLGIKQGQREAVQLDKDWIGGELARSSDGQHLAYYIWTKDQQWIRILDPGQDKIKKQFSVTSTVSDITWSLQNKIFIQTFRSTGPDYSTARGNITPGDYGYAILDLNTGKEEVPYYPDWNVHENQFRPVPILFSPSGDAALILGKIANESLISPTVRNWSLHDQKELWYYPTDDREFNNYVWSPNGKTIATIYRPDNLKTHFNSEIYLLDPSTGKAKQLTYYLDKIPVEKIHNLKWSPNGQYIIHWLQGYRPPPDQPADPSTLYIVDTKTNQATNLCIPISQAGSVFWSPDSHYLSLSGDGKIIVVDLQTYKSFVVYEGELPSVYGWTIP